MRRAITIAATLAAIGGGVAAGSAISQALTPSPLDELTPASGTTTVESTAPDPAGGPRWATRAYTTRTGLTCVEVGRILDTTFGDVRPDGTFAARGDEPSGTCGSTSDEPIVARNDYPARGKQPQRTVVFGLGDQLERATVTAGAEQHTAMASRRGTFLVVLAGGPPAELTVVSVDRGNGHRHTTKFGS